VLDKPLVLPVTSLAVVEKPVAPPTSVVVSELVVPTTTPVASV
jgi:hypothetical protein